MLLWPVGLGVGVRMRMEWGGASGEMGLVQATELRLAGLAGPPAGPAQISVFVHICCL